MKLKNLKKEVLDKSNKVKELHDYVKNIKTKIEQSTEYTLRTDLENLLNAKNPEHPLRSFKKTKKQKVRPLEDLTLKLPMKTWN